MKKHIGKIFIIALFGVFLYFNNVSFQPQQKKPVVTESIDEISVKPIQALKNASQQKSGAESKKEIPQSSEKKNSCNGQTTNTAEKYKNTQNKKDDIINDNENKNNEISHDKKDELIQTTCTLSIRCDTILNNIEKSDRAKIENLPKNGVIFAETTAEFKDGESVFDVLLRITGQNGIHLEFENSPIYNTAYIEGIANIYEFDFGGLSGWMYKVNGEIPKLGCSQYKLKHGDKIEFVYTCDSGKDIGAEY